MDQNERVTALLRMYGRQPVIQGAGGVARKDAATGAFEALHELLRLCQHPQVAALSTEDIEEVILLAIDRKIPKKPKRRTES